MRSFKGVMTRYYCYWTGEVRTLAGGTEGYRDGIGRQAQFFHPTGLTFDHRRKIVYVTDQVSILVCFGRSLTWFHWFERSRKINFPFESLRK